MTAIQGLRLKLVAEVDFRKSEVTNWTELAKKGMIARHLGENEVVLLVNKKRTQIVFVSAAKAWPGRKHAISIVHSRRLRITSGGSWNPLMLNNYAEEVGISLIGLKRFEDYYEELK
jgi:hypothetical protein